MSYFVHLEGMSVGKWPEFFMNPKSSLSHKRKMDKNCRVKKVNKKVITTHSSYIQHMHNFSKTATAKDLLSLLLT